MESGNLDLIITLVSIIGTVLAAFGFLHRELRRLEAKVDKRFERIDKRFERIDEKFERIDDKFERIDEKFERIDGKFDEKFDGVDGKFDGLRTVLTSVQVSVARIEGHLGIGFPARGEQRADDEPPERAA